MKNILFIGNSFTYFNELDQLLQRMADALGVPIHAERLTYGGYYLSNYTDPADPHFGEAEAKLSERTWDLVVLQEQSIAPAVEPERFDRGVQALLPLIRKAGAAVALYGTWPYKRDSRKLADSGQGLSYEEMHEKLIRAYEEEGRKIGAPVVRAGDAFFEAQEEHPDWNFYKNDGYHPNMAGSYLVACLFCRKLLGVEPPAAYVPEELEPKLAEMLREISGRPSYLAPVPAKRYDAILFDLDGTLLPMNMDRFVEAYLSLLAGRVAGPFGIDPKLLVKAVWKGTGAMMVNDGSCTNREAFWKVFSGMIGVTDPALEAECDRFYTCEFHQAKAVCGENPLAVKAVRLAREKAKHVALATNPLFPKNAQISRLSWVGLTPEDFELVTDYATDSWCKPNAGYYEAVCRRIGVKPENCLMIGNDEKEDMYGASRLGMDAFLVTDSAIASPEHPWNGPRGSFEEMIAMLEAL